jgi:hypothetical protein
MFTPIVSLYRFGEKCGTYESFTTVTFYGGEATINGLCQPISPKQARRFVRDMRLLGVHTLRYKRKGRLKVISI